MEGYLAQACDRIRSVDANGAVDLLAAHPVAQFSVCPDRHLLEVRRFVLFSVHSLPCGDRCSLEAATVRSTSNSSSVEYYCGGDELGETNVCIHKGLTTRDFVGIV